MVSSRCKSAGLMTASGQTRSFGDGGSMSGLPKGGRPRSKLTLIDGGSRKQVEREEHGLSLPGVSSLHRIEF